MKKVARLRVPQDEFVPPTGGKMSIDAVSVRTTGRIKKPKAVYDPSDNYVPRAQRLTQGNVQPQNVTSPKSTTAASPTTTVAKIQRERSLSTGSNTSNTSSTQDYDFCAVCEKREPRRGGNYRNKLFPCIDCHKKVHRMCATIDFYEAAPVRQSYKCENCRTCEVCNEHNTNTNGDIVMCAKCCKSYHPTCHTPKLTKIQQTQRNWKCFKCSPNTSNAIINSSSITSNGKEESLPVTVIRQIIGDDINLQALQKAQSQSQPQVSVQQKLEQSLKNSQTQPQTKSQDRINIAEAATEAAILAKRVGIPQSSSDNKRKSDSENVSSTSSATNESEDEDYNYVEKKKRKLAHDNQESNNNNENGNIQIKVNDSDSDSEKKTVLVNENHIADDIPYIPKREVIRTWSVERLTAYFEKYFPNEAYVFKDQDIDGNALLLLTRSDIVQNLSLKLGQSLRLFKFILKIQTQKLNDPTLGWDCSADTLLPSTE